MALLRNFFGIMTGAALSQFPEYSQQYVQRLGGAADELATVVAEFDTAAKEAGKTREEALNEFVGSEFLDDHQEDMRATISRSAYLSESYTLLKDAGAFERLSYIQRFADPKISARAWEDFQPAIPISIESLVLLLAGYIGGYGALTGAKRGLGAIRNRPNKHKNWVR